MGQPKGCRRKAQEQLFCCILHTLVPSMELLGQGGSTAGAQEPRTRVGPGQVKLGPKQVSLPLGWQDLQPPHANAALLLLSKPCTAPGQNQHPPLPAHVTKAALQVTPTLGKTALPSTQKP